MSPYDKYLHWTLTNLFGYYSLILMEKKITVINILGVLAVLIAVQIGYIFFKGKDLSSIIEPTIYSVVSAILIWTSGKTISDKDNNE